MGEPYSDRRYDQKDFDASSSDVFSESSSRERDHTPAEYSGSEEAVCLLLYTQSPSTSCCLVGSVQCLGYLA